MVFPLPLPRPYNKSTQIASTAWPQHISSQGPLSSLGEPPRSPEDHIGIAGEPSPGSEPPGTDETSRRGSAPRHMINPLQFAKMRASQDGNGNGTSDASDGFPSTTEAVGAVTHGHASTAVTVRSLPDGAAPAMGAGGLPQSSPLVTDASPQFLPPPLSSRTSIIPKVTFSVLSTRRVR